MAFQSGFVTIIGCPNVGKSTLMNALVGQKVSIVSQKAQTTRNCIQGVLTREDYQAVFVDTPGIHHPKTRLGDYMMRMVKNSMAGHDVMLVMIDGVAGVGRRDREILDGLRKNEMPVILVINKIDAIPKETLLPMIAQFQEESWIRHIVPVSALKGDGLKELEQLIRGFLPVGPKYFPDDMVTDQPERQVVAEFIREKALELLQEEVPHGVGVDVERMQEQENGVIEIFATIYCDKNSHKGIIIGKNGSMLKEIGRRARKEIEWLLMTRVYLELWVKVKEGWRNSHATLRQLGYSPEN
ncbi:MAG: GTPase Era [Christensenellales bacterium]